MNVVGNIFWFILGGFLPGFLLILFGLLMCITIVGIPAGIKTMKKGVSMFTPFGYNVELTDDTNERCYMVLNIIWLIIFGIVLVVFHLVLGLVLAVVDSATNPPINGAAHYPNQ